MKRVLTGGTLILLVLLLLLFNLGWLIALVSALLALLAAMELGDLTAKADAPIPFWWVVLAIVSVFLDTAAPSLDPLALTAVLGLLLFAVNSFSGSLGTVLPRTGAGVLLLLYVVYPLSLIPRIFRAEDGTALLLFLFLCVWCGDIAALYIGKTLGRRKLAPALSPNKTWEGSVASLLGSLLFGMALIGLGDWLDRRGSSFTRLHTSAPWWSFLLLAVLLNLAAQIGDLAESALKRGVGVKDSGTLLPGHGGMLDRLDALLFAAPVLWFALLLHSTF